VHPLLPLGLLLLASFGSGSKSSPQPTAAARPAPSGGAPPRKPAAKPATARPAQPSAAIRPKPAAPKLTIEHPDVTPAPAAEQAAVDAAVSQALRDMPPPPPGAGPSPNAPPAPVDAESGRSPKEAAQALLKFLIATGRFGSKTARQPEIEQAQRDLGVTADGIVGPKTREAAKRQGVALPPRK